MVVFQTYLRPAVHCINLEELGGIISIIQRVTTVIQEGCSVTIQMSMSNYLNELLPYIDFPGFTPPGPINGPEIPPVQFGLPKCRSGQMINQAVIGWHDHASDVGSCVVNLTNENWNETYRVPVRATVDHKVDGNFNGTFTIKMVAGGNVKHTLKLETEIIDGDPEKSSTCRTVNDPHITTFDGHYYNNYYDGYFYLYKNTILPYEVQVIYQTCTDNLEASCNCGVAVRSGDDVFVVDKCRRVDETCTGPSCPVMHTIMYVNGNLTNGTGIFSRDGASRFEVVLPIGTIVKIEKANSLLNVWVTPSPYDYSYTEGLCGTFNEDVSDDLTMPDGSLYEGNGTEIREQPRGFSQAWRVPENERIFEGAAPFEDDYDLPGYCKCHYIVIAGVECTCSSTQATETCDLDLGEEMIDELNAIWRTSNYRNSTDHTATGVHPVYEHNTDDIDIDEDAEPPDFEWTDDMVWNETAAETHCRQYLRTSDNLTQTCLEDHGEDMFTEAEFGCVEDIQITDSLAWERSALEAARKQCWEQWTRHVNYTEEDVESWANVTCLYDCNDNGECIDGECHCYDGWAGGDCTQISGSEPSMLVADTTMCDTRNEHCHYSTLYGHNFLDDGSLKCLVEEAQVDERGVKVTGKLHEVDILFVSMNQLACRLNSDESHYVALEWNGQSVMPPESGNAVLFITRDTQCYECDPEAQVCHLKDTDDYCYVEGGCYVDNDPRPNDDCRYCNITEHTREWTERTDEYCEEILQEEREDEEYEERLNKTRVSSAVILTALTILFTLLAFFCMRAKGKDDDQEYVKSNAASAYYGNPDGNTSKSDKKQAVDNPVYVNQTMSVDDETKKNPTETMESKNQQEGHHDNSIGQGDGVNVSPVAAAELLRIKQEAAAEKRTRTESEGVESVKSLTRTQQLAREARKGRERTLSQTSNQSVTSVRSLGLGGGASIHMGRWHPTVKDLDQQENLGIGGWGPAGITPALSRRHAPAEEELVEHHHHHHHHHYHHDQPDKDHTVKSPQDKKDGQGQHRSTSDDQHYSERL